MILKLENVFYKYNKNAPHILGGISCEFEKGKPYVSPYGGTRTRKPTPIQAMISIAQKQ